MRNTLSEVGLFPVAAVGATFRWREVHCRMEVRMNRRRAYHNAVAAVVGNINRRFAPPTISLIRYQSGHILP